ncbi:MAG TPA: hypothetical protein DCE41_14330 [Cytophagales bacterium]|nr:hypothetical protein [Cytophagales bacterium]
MIELIISPSNRAHLGALERIESMTLAKRIQYKEDQEPTLLDGGQEYRGLEKIDAYLDEMEQIVAQWYECRCDKYEDL